MKWSAVLQITQGTCTCTCTMYEGLLAGVELLKTDWAHADNETQANIPW